MDDVFILFAWVFMALLGFASGYLAGRSHEHERNRRKRPS